MSVLTDHMHHLHQRPPVEGPGEEVFALWVPSERITRHRVPVPSAPERKWPELIPWMLEDRILQPVEEIHFVICGREGDELEVFAVTREDLRHWLEMAEQVGVNVQSMVPDFMALPWEDGRISVAWREGLCLVRSEVSTGFAAEPDMAWQMIDQILHQAEVEPRLSISIPDEEMVPPHLRERADINTAPMDWHLSDVPANANLLTGEFKPRIKQVELRDWWPVCGLAVLVVVLFFIYLKQSSSRLEEEIVALDRQVNSGFRQLFPGVRQTSDSIRESAEETLAQLFRQQQSLKSPPMALLTELDAVIASCGCEVREIRLGETGGELNLSRAGRLASRPPSFPGYQVDVQAAADGDTVKLLIKQGAGQ